MINHSNYPPLNEAQKELLKFINPKDANCICKSLNNVFKMALFDSDNSINSKQKDDLFIVDKLKKLVKNISDK